MSLVFNKQLTDGGKTSKEIQYEKMLDQLTGNMKFIQPITYFQSIIYSIFFCKGACGDGASRLKKYKKQMKHS